MRLLPLPGVFQPHSDSRLLARCLQDELAGRHGAAVLDVCTGSGILALTAALAGGRATAVDVSRRACVAVKLNARLNGARVEVARGDLFAPVAGRRFDVIVSNPPYVPGAAVPRHGAARAWEGGPTGRALLDRIAREAAVHLAPGGAILLVHSSVCGEDATLDALRRGGLFGPGVVARERGALGPRMRERAAWLRAGGLLAPDATGEDVIVIRAVASTADATVPGSRPRSATTASRAPASSV